MEGEEGEMGRVRGRIRRRKEGEWRERKAE